MNYYEKILFLNANNYSKDLISFNAQASVAEQLAKMHLSELTGSAKAGLRPKQVSFSPPRKVSAPEGPALGEIEEENVQKNKQS